MNKLSGKDKHINLFINHPECSQESCDGILEALIPYYKVSLVNMHTIENKLFSASMIVFPGGIGDADTFDKFFTQHFKSLIHEYIHQGGRYLGICMGAYWAGKHYFNLLNGVEPVQYIKRPHSEIKRSYSTVATVKWEDETQNMFFYDGCALIGDKDNFDIVARYSNSDPMAIIQDQIGLIGCHPESQKFWYEKPRQYIEKYWHKNTHHELLKKFVDRLTGM